MLTFRKALIVAAFVLTCIYLFQSTHSSHNYGKASEGSSTGTPPIIKPESHSAVSSNSPTGSSGFSQDSQSPQKALGNPSGTLLERLQYQFPYDPEGKFPAYIWQTWKVGPGDGFFEEGLRPMEASWSELHPTFIHEVITDSTAASLIKYLYASVPEVIEAYTALPVPVLKADFFRYLILLARGGIYSDIDTSALKPATEWLPKTVPPSSVGLIVGIEADPDRPDWADWYSRRIQFCQWTIQSKAGHPALRKIVAQITEETLRMKKYGILSPQRMDMSIVEFTGPARWTDVVFSYFNDPSYFKVGKTNITWESFTNMVAAKRVGDVVVLPITSFSPGVQTMNAGETDDPMAFVKHDFKGKSKTFCVTLSLTKFLGSWKNSWEHVKPVMEIPAHDESS
jgi:alpha 1,6-mannosyltransferase